MKSCKNVDCDVIAPAETFPRGRAICRQCYNKERAAYRLKTREHRLRWEADYRAANPDVVRRAAERYRANRPELIAANQQRYRTKDPERYRKMSSDVAFRRRLRTHGLTEKEYFTLIGKQEGACWICRRIPTGNRFLVIDHRHSDSRVRGMLCDGCNLRIGAIQENIEWLESAASYLTNPPAFEILQTMRAEAQ